MSDLAQADSLVEIAPARSAPGRLTATVALAGALAVAAGLPVLAAADRDLTPDLAALWRSCLRTLAGLTWPVVACLLAVSVLHYLAAALAARAAAGVPLPFGELVATQLAASAANRITPGGLGGAGVIGRYLTRRGRLTPTQAAAAVSTLALLGGLADVVAFAAIVAVAVSLGLSGAGAEVPLLVSRLAGLVPLPGSSWRWLALGVAGAVVALVAVPPVRRSAAMQRAHAALGEFGRGITGVLRHPRRLGALMTASAGTTVLLAAGFAAAATAGPPGLPAAGFAALMIGYMVAAAAGNALPTPGGIGSADAALVGVLVAAHASMGSAVVTVLAFRLVTFWAPAVVGLALTRTLHRRGAL